MGFHCIVANIWGCVTVPVCCDKRKKFATFPPLIEVLATDTSDPAIAYGLDGLIVLEQRPIVSARFSSFPVNA